MNKKDAVQAAVNAVAVATTAINEYGRTSPEAESALRAARTAVAAAHAAGATDDDLRAARPQ
ncbi:hypothetical protein [Nocardia sp. NPDC051981]|uniref:hypothetical protein n=1 Tax=Nocardia sp. NPDC051981 TaxID=3155417 RepID=UPI00341DAFD3